MANESIISRRCGFWIKKTIAYAEKYGMCLNENQLWDRLMGPNIFSKKEVLRVVRKMRVVGEKQKNERVRKKERVARKIAKMISKNDKNLLLMGLTGSVAAGNCKRNDDIDVLIVTRKNRLWLSRLKLKWFLRKNRVGCRKYGERRKKDDFCFNMWLEEDSSRLPREKRTEKSAVDMILLKPLIDRGGVYEKFMRENRWAEKWVATPYREKLKTEKKVKRDEGLGQGGKLLNYLAFGIQYLYMWPKIEREKVERKRVFFHQG